MRPRLSWLSAAFFCLLAPAAGRAAAISAPDAPRATPNLLRELAREPEELPVIIGVRDGTPSARALLVNPDPEGEPVRRLRRIDAQRRLAEEFSPEDFRPRFFYESFSMMAGRASRQAILALAGHPDVAWITLDRQVRPLQTSPQSGQTLIGSDQANGQGFTGAGQTIAVIDTGVDYTIASMGGGKIPNAKVIGGMDFGDNDSDPMDCDGHGTEVAGTAAGPNGVAPDAKIVAIKVFSSQGTSNASCKDTADFSTIIAGINYAILNRAAFGITAINVSLGGSFDDKADHGYCDQNDPDSAAAIDSATAAGLVVAVSAGNDGLTNQLSDPACVSSALSVGAVYSDSRTRVSWSDGNGGVLCTDQPATPDAVVCFSNATTNLSVLAPGAFWKVATKGGGTDTVFAGTSAAAPAVAGAVALLRQAQPGLSASAVIGILRATGRPITDTRTGLITPRVDTVAAVQLAASNFAAYSGAGVAIPDGTGSATATAIVSGFTRTLATVQVWVSIDHPSPAQLRVTLIGPDGTAVVLQDQSGTNEHPINAIYGKTDAPAQSLGAFAGKQANGTWTVKVEDLVAGVTGRIRNFAVVLVPLIERQAVSKAPAVPRVPRSLQPRS